MTLLAIFQWLQSTEVATALRESSWVYPIVMATHLTGMALFGGMILISDMRLLGLVMRGSTVTDVVGGLRPWKHFGCCSPPLAAFSWRYRRPSFIITILFSGVSWLCLCW